MAQEKWEWSELWETGPCSWVSKENIYLTGHFTEIYTIVLNASADILNFYIKYWQQIKG